METNTARDANRGAFSAWSFRPQVLVNRVPVNRVLVNRVPVNTVGRSLATPLCGKMYAAPFGIAPIGATSLMAFKCERVLTEALAIPFVLSGSSLMKLETILRAN